MLTLTNPEGKTGRITQYDSAGRVREAIDVNGITIKLSYNVRGWLTTYDLGGQQIRYEYDVVGQRTAMLGPQDLAMRWVYDSAHRLTEILANLTVSESSVQTGVVSSLAVPQGKLETAPPTSLQTVHDTAVRAWNAVLNWIKQWLSAIIQSAHAQVPPVGGDAMSSIYQLSPPISSGSPSGNRSAYPEDLVDQNSRDHVRPDLRSRARRQLERIGSASGGAVCRGGDTTREACKQDCVTQHEDDVKNCSIAHIFWGKPGYKECVDRAGEYLRQCMMQCDGK
ncbi:hypothetical protein [Ralstonia sp. A12]|uniref:hypothetical protein n=1 Tax=Ralstonia sp. A12 TaxID=1217052 RepID=UPI001E5C0BB7